MRVLITGASGFIGSHIVERLASCEHEVTAFVRPTSDRATAAAAGALLRVGDLSDTRALSDACRGQDCVIHTAGLVTTGRTRRQFDKVVVRGTSRLLEAAIGAGVPRFVHLSSIAVHDPRRLPFAETTPLIRRAPSWNHYARAKVRAEQSVWRAHSEGKIAVTVLRPSVTLGPRDRHTTPTVIALLQSRLASIVGRGDNPIACVVVEELADAVVRAAESASAAGKAYNLSGRGEITQIGLLRLHAEATGVPMPTRHVPYGVAMGVGAVMDWVRSGVGEPGRASASRFAVWVAGTPSTVDASVARRELGWEGRASYADAIHRAVASTRARQNVQTPAAVEDLPDIVSAGIVREA